MRIRGLVAVVLSVAAISLTACSSSEDSATDDTSAPVATSAAASSEAEDEAEDEAEGEATRVDVMESEYTIELSETEFKPGKYTFVVMNHGNAPHDLTITGPGADDVKSSRVTSGQTTELTVDLEAGEYELWCSIGSHKSQGMTTTITVA
jgi:plastocyanin